jgi:unsaturated chondroitin disaccharide hydrolase
LTGDPYYRDVLLTAASSLASRYSSEVGAISCCDWNYPNWQFPVVIDTMMNLELLLWAAANGGQDDWRNMAIHHADRTAADIVRADGSTYHFADYDPVSGTLLNRGTFQGYSDDSTWARGQAWAMYGYTMVYRYTHARRFLTLAQRTTDWYLSHLPDDGVPNWDFDAPILVKDSSAAAIAASAMLELSGYVKDSTVAKRYRAAAVRTLEILSSSAYLAKGTTSQSILLHGVRFLPAGKGIDVGLVYGDYYFLEALTRFDRRRFPWMARFSFPASIHRVGASNTGLQLVEFNVTPLAAPIDGVIGYADSSTTVTAYSILALAVRMNASGQFDVRNGNSYAALTDVPYQANKTYYVRILADLDHRRYSVWVTPPGQTEVQIARDFAFRDNAPFTDDLGQLSLKVGYRDDEFILDSHSIRPATGYVR